MRLSCVLVMAAMVVAPLRAQNPEFDLLIRNGHVIDPQNAVNVVMDVAVTGSKIALVASNIAPACARQVVDATGFSECELTVKAGRVGWALNGISRPWWTEMRDTR